MKYIIVWFVICYSELNNGSFRKEFYVSDFHEMRKEFSDSTEAKSMFRFVKSHIDMNVSDGCKIIDLHVDTVLLKN